MNLSGHVRRTRYLLELSDDGAMNLSRQAGLEPAAANEQQTGPTAPPEAQAGIFEPVVSTLLLRSALATASSKRMLI